VPIRVVRQANESEEQLLRRFRKKVQRSKLMSEVRRRRWHVTKGELRRIQKKKALRRVRRRQRTRTDR
jgi:small subunit ribosomal protein S21